MKSGTQTGSFSAILACQGVTVPDKKGQVLFSQGHFVGSARSRRSFFMNPFRKIAFIECKAESRYIAHC